MTGPMEPDESGDTPQPQIGAPRNPMCPHSELLLAADRATYGTSFQTPSGVRIDPSSVKAHDDTSEVMQRLGHSDRTSYALFLMILNEVEKDSGDLQGIAALAKRGIEVLRETDRRG